MSEKKSDFCGDFPIKKKRCCFDEKMIKGKWNCSDDEHDKHKKNKHDKQEKDHHKSSDKCKCDDKKKEEKHKPFDRCKCKDFKVVYFVPKFFIDEQEKKNDSNHNSGNYNANHNKYQRKFENKNYNKHSSTACGCHKRI
jgi:hypothetical protein